MSNRGCSLVTGGGGFIGAHLVRQLLEQGETVKVLELADTSLPSDVEVIQGSVNDVDTVRRALKGVQRLYHLAANPNLWAQDKHIFKQVNYQGTCTVLSEAARADLEVLVYTSTESILTSRRQGGDPIDSSVIRELNEMPGPYCRSKFLAEQAAFEAAKNGLPVVIVSPTLPIGPGDRRITPPTRMILNFLNCKIPAYLDCRFNMVDVRDVARGHILAAQHGRPGERYILGHENLTLGDLLRMIEEITGLAMPKLRIPHWVALIVGAFSELTADYITHASPKAPLTGVRLAARSMFFESDKAVQELGFKQSSLRQALIDQIEWLVKEGYVTRSLPLQQNV
ncbi:hopanoid-associated sugar epimerase [Nitrosomonas communis]|uniref:hopanoid-associated sugar epimerase n=1 Tax=Nitrosomonas communis TaxID=44574 RepID=UPI0026F1A636|nr:hopanoid-associated sugar epimerase [Nitrosomonas communis]MCO6429154.1 NAD-dependent epimerase/dehydratase family protein [Nitrosomonas communis]